MGLAGWLGGGPERKHAKLNRSAPSGALGGYAATPLPARTLDVAAVPLLAIDMETTGLDPARDHILSIGWVPVDGRVITLAGAGRVLVRPPAGVGASATIHGLTDDAVQAGISVEEALDVVLPALTGRVLLAHYARIETSFLDAAARRRYGTGLPFQVVDTMELARRILTRGGAFGEPKSGALRLWTARGRYGLPTYAAHDALIDALACAELYLAQVAEISQDQPLALARLLS